MTCPCFWLYDKDECYYWMPDSMQRCIGYDKCEYYSEDEQR